MVKRWYEYFVLFVWNMLVFRVHVFLRESEIYRKHFCSFFFDAHKKVIGFYITVNIMLRMEKFCKVKFHLIC